MRGRSERAGAGARGGSDWLGSRDSSVALPLGMGAGGVLGARKVVADGG